MKALDHVLLWVARVCAFSLLIQACAMMWFRFQNHWPTVWLFGIKGLAVNGTIWSLVSLFLCIVWSYCLWRMESTFARLLLRFSAGLFFAGTAILLLHQLSYLSHMVASYIPHFIAVNFLMFGIPVLGYAAMIWISFHPPQNSLKNPPLPSFR